MAFSHNIPNPTTSRRVLYHRVTKAANKAVITKVAATSVNA